MEDSLPHPNRRRRPRVRPRGSGYAFGSPSGNDDESQSNTTCCLGGGLGLLMGGMTGDGGRDDRRSSKRRSRQVQATASAFLALCALVVLSGDAAHLPGFQSTLTSLVSASRRLAEDSSSPSSGGTGDDGLIPVSGVRTATFFLPVEPHLKYNNKMNSHYSLAHYAQGLANTCQFLTKLDHPAYVLGDQDFIQSRAQNCQQLTAEEAGRYRMEDLNHAEGAAMVQRHMCHRKFATDKHDARRILKEHVLMYLNKLDVLCDLAQDEPNDLTVLVDSDLDPELWSTVMSLIDRRKKDARDKTLTVWEHPDYGYRSWFGRPSCRTHPTANTEFMAIRGKDCPAVLQAFRDTLAGLVETASKVNLLPDAGPCPCFDDEIVLHYLMKDHPDLISFFGVPRAIDTDDDDSLFDEDVADEVDFGAVGRMLKYGDDVDKKEGGGDDEEEGTDDDDEEADEEADEKADAEEAEAAEEKKE
mmetsp:Transcript_30604/g.89424  ORF Transcript_30604/g.89424 Transcript_30604/m.89424 type:complete len:471 (-) Transcript_30604:37-1449(-)